MGTVGLSFGSPTSGDGFNVSTTVSQIISNMEQIETPWKSQLATLQSQDTVLSSLGSGLSSLSTDLQNLTDFDGVFAGKQGSSSDTNVLQLTSATSSAQAGTNTVVVNSLATTSSYVSTAVPAADAISGSLTITPPGGGNAVTVAVPSGTATLAGLASAINNAGAGVTASVITDSSGTRLSLVSTSSGSAGNFSITSQLSDKTAGTNINISQAQSGQDASLTVDGIAVTSGSNTVSNAISGVTMQLLSASPGTAVQVVVGNDTSSITTALQQFVTDYNTVIQALNAQEQNSSGGTAEPLYGSPVVAGIQEQLQNALASASSGSGGISSITQLGVNVNNDGTLTLNTDTLTSALNTDYTDVTGFFQNTSSFGSTFTQALNASGGSAPDGAVYLTQQANATEEQSLNTSIANEQDSINTQQTQLTAELTSADYTLQAIPEQLDEINEMYAAITGYNPTSS